MNDILDLPQSDLETISIPDGVVIEVTEMGDDVLCAEARCAEDKLLVVCARALGAWFESKIAVSIDVYTGPNRTYSDSIRFNATRDWLRNLLEKHS